MARYQKRIQSPETRPIRHSGLAVSYWSEYWHKWITRAIVPRTAKPSKWETLSRENFKLASYYTKNMDAGLQAEAMENSAGTPFLWRDLLMLNVFGKLTEFTTPDGLIWKGRRVLYAEIQQLLASIGITKGAMLVRTDDGWVQLAPGAAGQIIQMDPLTGLPKWIDGNSGGSGSPLGAGKIWLGNSLNVAADVDISGDIVIDDTGFVEVVSSGGLPFAASAFLDALNASNITAGTLAAARGGAGTVNGILKANGGGAVSLAVAKTDYALAPPHTDLLGGDASGGFTSLPVGTGLSIAGGTLHSTAVPGGSLNSFRGYRSAAANTTSAGAQIWTVDAVAWDSASWWDATNHRYVPQIAGKYFFNTRYRCNTNGTCAAYIYKNGVLSGAVGVDSGSTSVSGSGGSMMLDANGTTDYFQPGLFANSARAMTNGTNDCYFEVIGPY